MIRKYEPTTQRKGGALLKFKIFSAALLLICFLFLGVLSGAIPVTFGGADPADRAAMVQTDVPPTDQVRPTARPAPTGVPADMAPSLTEPPSPSPTAGPTATSAAKPTATARPTATSSAEPTATARPTATSSAEPTAVPTAAPDAETASSDVHLWEPEARVVPTTITWSDPLDNDTDYDVDGAALLGKDPAISLPEEGYQILIIHTHGTEAFTPDGADQYEATADYRTTDKLHTIIRVGQALAKALEEQGLRVLVDTELYDWPSYDGSYSRCEQSIRAHLAEDPSIAMVIDLHRDALGDDELMWRPVSDGMDAAQIMFVIGTDKNLDHPHWRDNLALAMSLQGIVEDKYPHLMRPTLLCQYRYNQQLTPGSVLLEIGAAGNTLDEAISAAELFADAVGPALAARIGA